MSVTGIVWAGPGPAQTILMTHIVGNKADGPRAGLPGPSLGRLRAARAFGNKSPAATAIGRTSAIERALGRGCQLERQKETLRGAADVVLCLYLSGA